MRLCIIPFQDHTSRLGWQHGLIKFNNPTSYNELDHQAEAESSSSQVPWSVTSSRFLSVPCKLLLVETSKGLTSDSSPVARWPRDFCHALILWPPLADSTRPKLAFSHVIVMSTFQEKHLMMDVTLPS